MIDTFVLKKKEVVNVSLDKLKLGKGLCWIDGFNLKNSDIESISDKTGIPIDQLKEAISENKRPHVIIYKNYSLIVFHGYIEKNMKLFTVPVSLFVINNCIISIHDKPIDSITSLKKSDTSQKSSIFLRGEQYLIYRIMDGIIEEFFGLLDNIGDAIDKIEDVVIKEPGEPIIKNIFIYKRKLIYINKSLIANRDVVSSLEKKYLEDFKDKNIELMRTLYFDIAQLIDLVGTYREISTSILDMYISSISNNLNKVVKTLTVISAFVLIPTLITGIYGMNFQKVSSLNMPELYWVYGYPFALGLMLAAVIIMYFMFKKKGWL